GAVPHRHEVEDFGELVAGTDRGLDGVELGEHAGREGGGEGGLPPLLAVDVGEGSRGGGGEGGVGSPYPLVLQPLPDEPLHRVEAGALAGGDDEGGDEPGPRVAADERGE